MAKLIKRGKSWYSDFSYFENGSRCRVVKVLSKDRRIAEEKLRELVSDRDSRKHGNAPLNPSFEQFQREYLRWCVGAKSKGTYYWDRLSFRELHKLFPIQRLKELTPEILDHLKARLKTNGKSKQTVNREISSLKAAMHKAESWGWIRKQDWALVKKFQVPKGRLLWYSQSEVSKLLRFTNGCWKTMVLLGVLAGLRREEMYYLEWVNVHFNLKKIHIVAKDGWQPKGGGKDRWIPMTKHLESHLESITRGQSSVLAHDNVRPTLGSMTNYFKRLVSHAGLKGGLHTLRHTFASHLAQKGVPIPKISKWMGHASLEQTMVYAHLCQSTDDAEIERLPVYPGL